MNQSFNNDVSSFFKRLKQYPSADGLVIFYCKKDEEAYDAQQRIKD